MRIFLICIVVLGLFLFCSCESTEKKEAKELAQLTVELEGKIKDFFESNVRRHGENITIQDVEIYKIDTLTPLMDSMLVVNYIKQNLRYLREEEDHLFEIADLKRQQAQISVAMGGRLAQSSIEDAQQALDKVVAHRDQMEPLLNRGLLIDSLVLANVLDSTTAIGYLAWFNIKAINDAHVAQDIDSGRIAFDLDKRLRQSDIDWMGLN